MNKGKQSGVTSIEQLCYTAHIDIQHTGMKSHLFMTFVNITCDNEHVASTLFLVYFQKASMTTMHLMRKFKIRPSALRDVYMALTSQDAFRMEGLS